MSKPNEETKYGPDFVKSHAREILDFYLPGCVDEQVGGFYQGYLRDGSVYDKETKDLIGTARFVVDFSLAEQMVESGEYDSLIEHGLSFLLNEHRDQEQRGYFQHLSGREPDRERKKLTYSHAFVILALSSALKAGFPETKPYIIDTFNLLEENLWEEKSGLYATEASRDFSGVPSYRGQNANMHMVEALIMAYEATHNETYLNRATGICKRVTQGLAEQTDGLIWEHYTARWEIDPDYNRDDPENIYRPFGFLPGHQIEWAKLLLILERHNRKPWQKPTAIRLFDRALEYGWDRDREGFIYTFDFDREVLNRDRYYWVHAEAIATAYLLWKRTGELEYFTWYERFWDYSLENLVDSEFGGWYRVVSPSGKPSSNRKSIPGKTDYHAVNTCYEIYRTGNNQLEDMSSDN